MEKDLFVTCDFAQDNAGKLTAVGIFDVINVPQFPATHPFLSAAAILKFDQYETGTYDVKIAIKDPNNTDILPPGGGKAEVKSRPNNAPSKLNIVINMTNVIFNLPGTHACQLLINDKVKYSIPLYVEKLIK